MAAKKRPEPEAIAPTLKTEIKPLPLALDRIALRAATYEEKETTEPPLPLPPGHKMEMRVDFQGAVGSRESLLELQLKLRVEPDAKYMPFVVSVVYSAYFVRDASMDDDAALAFLHSAGVRILFPYIRETISSLTSKGLFGVLFLDPMDIQMFQPPSQSP